MKLNQVILLVDDPNKIPDTNNHSMMTVKEVSEEGEISFEGVILDYIPDDMDNIIRLGRKGDKVCISTYHNVKDNKVTHLTKTY